MSLILCQRPAQRIAFPSICMNLVNKPAKYSLVTTICSKKVNRSIIEEEQKAITSRKVYMPYLLTVILLFGVIK